MVTDKERIEKAAIKYKSKIYIGFDHGECFKQLNNPEITMAEIKQGFITSSGKFVDRKQATKIAIEAGQIDEYTAKQCLISEDLHLNWLNELENNQNQRAVEALQKVKGFAIKEINECNKLLQEETMDDYYIQAVNARQSMCFEFRREIDQLIKELGGNDE